MRKILLNWPWILTFIVVILSIYIFFTSTNISTAAQISEFFGGVATTLAFIWLIAGFLYQRKELELQRNELSLQRASLDLQKEELKKISKFNALEQISRMLGSFNASLPSKNLPGVTAIENLYPLFVKGMVYWNGILDSENYKDVVDAYTEWKNVESPCLQFLSIVSSAVNMYAETTGEISVQKYEDDAAFIYFNYEKINKIPHIQQYIGTAYILAQDMIYCAPGLKRIRLAGLTAMNKLVPGSIDEEALQKLRGEVEELDREKAIKKDKSP